jgi:DNA-binding IscR family transcriptional regulator
VRLMEGPLAPLRCVSETQHRRCADCADYRTCELRKVFRGVRDSTAAILDGWTLADARGNGSPPATRLRPPLGKQVKSVRPH